ncbi:MAG: rhomboid family intramembrane serine protease [Actinobacteria bacterium]|nr:rhomboid family intramembrane serine protease [Actinomycetota bacterium]
MVIPLRDDNPTSRFPVLTVLLIAANIFIFAFVQPHSDTALNRFDYEYAAIPCELVQGKPASVVEINNGVCNSRLATPPAFPHKNVYLAVLVSMFLHGSWLHVLGNMLFLWIFGNNVEDRFGTFWFALFYLFAGILAATGHIIVNHNSLAPFIGASGAIAGVMGVYFVFWPAARILTILFIVPLYLPAWFVLGFWVLLQFFTDPNSGVAWVAHVTGFATGIVVALLVRPLFPPRARPMPGPAGTRYRS